MSATGDGVQPESFPSAIFADCAACLGSGHLHLEGRVVGCGTCEQAMRAVGWGVSAIAEGESCLMCGAADEDCAGECAREGCP